MWADVPSHAKVPVRCGSPSTVWPRSRSWSAESSASGPVSGGSEAVACVAEVALAEGEDLGGCYREDQGHTAIFVVKRTVTDLVVPSSVPLRGPRRREAFQRAVVANLDGITLDHHVQPTVPAVAAGGQGHVRACAQIDGLLLAGAGGEVDRPVEPHGNQGCDVGPPVRPDRADPEQVGRLQRLAGLIPARGNRAWLTEPRIDLGNRLAHRSAPRRWRALQPRARWCGQRACRPRRACPRP